MVRIVQGPDCGNAPRVGIVRDLVVAVAERDVDTVWAWLAEGIEWTLDDGRVLSGHDDVRDLLTSAPEAAQVEFRSILTHGREASVDGTITTVDGATRAFCHMLRFTGAAKTATIAGVRSYTRAP